MLKSTQLALIQTKVVAFRQQQQYLRYRFAQKPDVTLLLRVDGKKVYWSREVDPCNTEILMYDFGLEIGESFTGGFSKFADFTVTKRDSVVLLNGEVRLRLTLEDGPSERIWIDGIGDIGFGVDSLCL